MANWIEVCGRDDVPPGDKLCVMAEDHAVVLCDVKGELSAVSNLCPHAGLPLAEGELAGAVLTCVFHGYAYDVRTGRNIDFPNEECPVRRFPVKVVDGRIWVDIEKLENGENTDNETSPDAEQNRLGDPNVTNTGNNGH